MSEIKYAQIKVALPNHWAVDEENLWVEPLGDDLYRVENIPFYAYGVNYQDIVHAKPAANKDDLAEITKLVEWGGHQSMRLYFSKKINAEEQEKLIAILAENNIIHQRADNSLVAIDIPPGLDAHSVYDFLEDNAGEDRFEFETCEERVEKSFDDGV